MANIITIPNGSIIYDIDIEMYRQNHLDDVYAKQYDTNTRYIRATIWNCGTIYPITSDKTITFSCTKPDGYGIDNPAGIDTEGRIVYLITDQTSAKSGNFKAEFRIYSTQVVGETTISKRETTYDFNMHVAKSALDDTTVISTNEFNILTHNIGILGDLIADANTLIPIMNQAKIDEAQRVINENERKAAELLRPDYIYLTQAQYDALSQAEKDDPLKIYEITDNDGIFPSELQNLIDQTTAAKNAAESLVVNKAGINDTTATPTEAYSGYKTQGLIGDLGQLTTSVKANLVGAINENTFDIKILKNLVVDVADFGALGNGTDETQQILNAINYFLTNADKKVLKFSGVNYVISQKLPIISKDVVIIGCTESYHNTIINYSAESDGYFLENSSTGYSSINSITLNITPNGYNVGGMLFYKGTKSTWGKRVFLNKVEVLGYATDGIKIYAPYMCEGNNLQTWGYGNLVPNPSDPKKPNPSFKTVGLNLIGYEADVIDTFGNVNIFINCQFGNNIYGVKLISIGSTCFNNCVFEPNFINVYSISPTTNSYAHKTILDKCWMEDYLGINHPTMGAYVTYEFDETTGDLFTPLRNAGHVYLVNTTVNNTCKIDPRMMGGFTYDNHLIYSHHTFPEIEAVDSYIFKIMSDSGDYVSFDTLKNYFRNVTQFKKGVTLLALEDNSEKAIEYHNFVVSNPNTDKNTLFSYEIPFDIPVSGMLCEVQVDAVLTGTGNDISWVRASMYRNTVCNATVLNENSVIASEIDSNNKGIKLNFDIATQRLTVDIKGASCTSCRLQVEVIKRK